jgi:DNA topoisomerase-1
MAKNLLIVESPAKAKTIEGYLGKDFLVKSSYGHIRDLVKGDMGIDIDNNFSQTYEVPAEKKQLVAELKKLAISTFLLSVLLALCLIFFISDMVINYV